MTNYETYESPFCTRYASEEMQFTFSAQKKFSTFRRLWVALARAEMKLGLEQVTQEKVDELEAHIDDIDFAYAAEEEKKLRHDVMAHVHTYGKCCPKAEGIIHLGATSCYVGDNTDVIVMRDAMKIVHRKLVNVLSNFASFADKYKDMPCLAYTHLQPAQLTTVGKRATLWMNELLMDLEASDEQLDCPFVYASAKAGYASLDPDVQGKDMTPLFDTILDYIPAPEGDATAPTQVLISTIDYNEYVGRIGVGKVDRGTISVNQDVVIVNHHDPDKMRKSQPSL